MERRAININIIEIARYTAELAQLNWKYENLIFLDEVSFNNRDMLRKRGYALKGQKLLYRGEFQRKPRVSLLCFLSINGIEEVYQTDGTFDRKIFVQYCRDFAVGSKRVYTYPGKNSIWILDGAKIHCDSKFTSYLRSLGIYPIFLPAYCPFFNPIEIVFGLVKKSLQRNHDEFKVTIFFIFFNFIRN